MAVVLWCIGWNRSNGMQGKSMRIAIVKRGILMTVPGFMTVRRDPWDGRNVPIESAHRMRVLIRYDTAVGWADSEESNPTGPWSGGWSPAMGWNFGAIRGIHGDEPSLSTVPVLPSALHFTVVWRSEVCRSSIHNPVSQGTTVGWSRWNQGHQGTSGRQSDCGDG